MRKTSLALASIAGAVTFFIAPQAAGQGKGFNRSATFSSALPFAPIATCAEKEWKQHMVYEFARYHASLVTTKKDDLKRASKLMGLTVSVCISPSKGFIQNAAHDSWMAGQSTWWAIATMERSLILAISRPTTVPRFDLSPGDEKDCVKSWTPTECSRPELIANCALAMMASTVEAWTNKICVFNLKDCGVTLVEGDAPEGARAIMDAVQCDAVEGAVEAAVVEVNNQQANAYYFE